MKFTNDYPRREDKISVANSKAILFQNIESNPVGRHLTADAHRAAVGHAYKHFHGNTGNGEAAQTGIRAVTSSVFRR